jgi:hypothetical protein
MPVQDAAEIALNRGGQRIELVCTGNLLERLDTITCTLNRPLQHGLDAQHPRQHR